MLALEMVNSKRDVEAKSRRFAGYDASSRRLQDAWSLRHNQCSPHLNAFIHLCFSETESTDGDATCSVLETADSISDDGITGRIRRAQVNVRSGSSDFVYCSFGLHLLMPNALMSLHVVSFFLLKLGQKTNYSAFVLNL